MALQKTVGLAPFANPVAPGSFTGDLRFPRTRGFFTDTRTGWVRFFAQWNFWFPETGDPDVDRDQFEAQRDATDANIILAKSLGLRVILCFRGSRASAVPAGEPLMQGSNRFTWPRDQELKADGLYSDFIAYLMDRYHPSNRNCMEEEPPVDTFAVAASQMCPPGVRRRWIDMFEVVNEPNLEYGPVSEGPAKTALMFKTALRIARSYNKRPGTGGRPLRLLGPATAAIRGPGRRDFERFTRDLLDELDERDFPMNSKIFGWSHHNYFDVQRGMPRGSLNRSQQVRAILRNAGWAGMSPPGSPQLWLTEGGYARPPRTVNSRVQDRLQERMLRQSIDRLNGERGPGGPGEGIAMFTQFLFFTQAGTNVAAQNTFDSGLVRPPRSRGFDGGKRPAYVVWKNGF